MQNVGALLSAVLAAHAAASLSITWTDALDLSVGGRPFPALSGNVSYARLPSSAQEQVSQGVWLYSRHAAGIFTQFQTDASSIFLNYTLTTLNSTVFSNFPAIGMSGCDLYRFDETTTAWRWVATTFDGLANFNTKTGVVVEAPLMANSSGWPVGPAPSTPVMNGGTMVQYRLHFPSYNGVSSLSIGIPKGATIAPDDSWMRTPAMVAAGGKSVVYYGTSITQGGVTNRPGQTYVNRIRRTVGIDIINMGFCGSCKMELAVGAYLAQIPASLFVIDCAWNMAPSLIANNTVPLVLQLRAAQPGVPIMLVEPSDFRPSWILGDTFNNTGRKLELAAAYARLQALNVTDVHYVLGESLYTGPNESPYHDPTFEGTHPHDHGHLLIANILGPIIGGIVGAPGYTRPVPVDADELLASRVGQYETVLASGILSADRAIPSAVQTPTIPLSLEPVEGQAASSACDQCANDPFTNVTWTDAPSLTISGRFFNDTPTPYNRLPSSGASTLRPAVWDLSLNSAGLRINFASNSPTVYVNYTADGGFASMVHFPLTGMSGMELYAWDANVSLWRHVQPAQLLYGVDNYAAAIASNMLPVGGGPGGLTRFMLYCPTYMTPSSISVGVEEGSTIIPDTPFNSAAAAEGESDALPAVETKAPIVWYGTSILQGGVSFKSGNIFTSLISRALDREVYNYGFSGNCEMELNVTQYLQEIPNPSVFILDCNRNMNNVTIAQRALPLLRAYRAVHPTTPIILAEGTPMGMDWAVPVANDQIIAQNVALRAAYDTLVSEGDKNVHYVTMDSLFSPASLIDTPTSAGLHPTDEGMMNVASFYIDYLPTVIGN